MKREKDTFSYLIRTIGHMVQCMQDKCLVHYGLTNQQARLIGEIYELSKKKKVFGRKELEQALNLKGPSVTSLLHGLEKKKLIETVPSETDARRKILKVTEEGQNLLKHMNIVFEATENQLLECLTGEEKDKFKEFLAVAYENVSMK